MERLYAFVTSIVAVGAVGSIIWLIVSMERNRTPPPPPSYLITVEGLGEFHARYVDVPRNGFYFLEKDTGKGVWISYNGAHTIIVREE